MGVSWKGLLFVLSAISCFMLVSGCAQKSPGEINYLGLMYEQSSHMLMPDEKLFYTGVSVDGLQIYAPVKRGETPPKAPEWIFPKGGDGKYYQYRLSTTGNYAYVLYGEYNANETIVFGLTNATGGIPVEIQRNDNGTWTNVSSSALKMTAEDGGREWTWDQRMQDGDMAGPGQYRALIGPNDMATFNISTSLPALEVSDVDYYNATRIEHYDPILDITGPSPEYHAFGQEFNDSQKTKADTASLLEYKAWMKGQDPFKLESAFDSIYAYGSNDSQVMFFNSSTLIPSYALHANYDGRPAWYIVYNWEVNAVFDSYHMEYIGVKKEGPCMLMHVMLFVVDDETGKVLHWESCA